MASMQKNKGSGFERDVAKWLTNHYGETFIRTIGSGAYIGKSNQHRLTYLTESQTRSHKGDITPPENFYHANIECKFYQDLKFHQLFVGDCPLLDTWIEQVLDVEEPNDVNIIFMKFNRKGLFVCFQDRKGLSTKQALHYKGEWYVLSFDKFFEYNSENFKLACAKEVLADG